MKELFTLGELYLCDFLKDGEKYRGSKHELKLVLTDDGNVRLDKPAPSDQMFGRYFYRSGTNQTMKDELKSIVDSCLHVSKLKENDLWIDIACNEGTLLSFVPKNLIRIGIDPADDSYKVESEKHSDLIIQDYFTSEIFKKSKFGSQKAKIITCIACFYDLTEPDKFLQDVNDVLDDSGLFVCQLSYTPLMIEQLAFDNILGEHYYYYSLFNLKALFEKNGFKIVDCQLNDTNGGSFRVYAQKTKADDKYFATQPYRDVANFRVNSLLEYEKTLKLDEVETWIKFKTDIDDLKEKLVSFLKEEKSKGKKIYGYAASTKSATLLQYFGIGPDLIESIAERNPIKWGTKMPGINIPIVSEDEVRQANPNYLLILSWHFAKEFISREQEMLLKGTKFIVPCPKFEIISS
jgi:ubiquinone/menaquinone biosynthesis C-methylase UbiE